MLEKKVWWKESVVYQVYPRSFMDSNGDGIGDLNGVRSKIPYFKELGIDVIWLSPVYQSPNDDNGYDISDYRDIMAEFGTIEDFDELLKEAHENGIKIIMDLVVNHSSDEHVWFAESRKSKDNPYRDYYIWREEKNNWESAFGGPAWKYDDATNMYYLHMFSEKQPDLNWENEKVREEIFDMMTWWGRKGIDGFRMDVISMISKDQSFPDGKVNGGIYGDSMPYVNNGPRVHEYLQEMNGKVLSKFDWMTVGEGAGVDTKEALNYTGFNRNELNMIFHFEHVCIGQGQYGKWCDGKVDLVELKTIMTRWQVDLEGIGWNSLYWDNHDQPRAVSRFGNDSEEYREISAKMLATCLHFMKGTPFIYQGEELGMTNHCCNDISQFRDIESLNAYRELVEGGKLSKEEMLSFINKMGRDNARFPMHWDESENAGFTSGTPWIGINPNYREINSKLQMHNKHSVFSYYKRLIELRHSLEAMVYGVYEILIPESHEIYAYTRSYKEQKLLVICNFVESQVEFSLPEEFRCQKEVLISNYYIEENKENSKEEKIILRPYEAIVYRKG